MLEPINLIKHSISEPHKVKTNPGQKVFYSQNWVIPFQSSINEYYSPYFSHPTFKIVFMLSFNGEKGKAKLSSKLAGQFSYDDPIYFYFTIGNPTKKRISFYLKWGFELKKQSNSHTILQLTKSDIINNNNFLNEDGTLNFSFQLCYKMRRKVKEQSLPLKLKSNPHFCGLVNKRSICYMNSSIQILFHIPGIRQLFYSYDATNDKSKKIINNVQFLFYMMSNLNGFFDPIDLHNSVMFCRRGSGRQKDAHEFITEFLREISAEIADSEQEKKLNGLFEFSINLINESLTKNTKKVDVEKNLSLSLPLMESKPKKKDDKNKSQNDQNNQSNQNNENNQNNQKNENNQGNQCNENNQNNQSNPNNENNQSNENNQNNANNSDVNRNCEVDDDDDDDESKPIELIDLIKKFQSKSEVDIEINKKVVEKVNIWEEFVNFPSILIIHLLRLVKKENECFLSKLTKPVIFNETLDLECFSHNPNDKYELYAILVHKTIGDGGHYYSYIRNFHSSNWFLFNDSIVSPSKSPFKIEDIQKLAYLLFYVRKSDIPVLFKKEKDKIAPNMKKMLDERKIQKEKEIYNENTLTFRFIFEDELNSKDSITGMIKPSKSIQIHKSKSQYQFYEEVSNFFKIKFNEIRLWSLDQNMQATLIDRYVDQSVQSIKSGKILIQYKNSEENFIPFIENNNFEDFNCLVIFIKYFDARLKLPIRYVGHLIVEESSTIDLPQIRTLLDFPLNTKFHFFKEVSQLIVKPISPTSTFKSAQLENGNVLIVQVDCDKENLPDLSKSEILKNVDLLSTFSIPKRSASNGIRYLNLPSYNAVDILKDINKDLLCHYLAIRYSMRNFFVYDYEDQKKPSFTLTFPSSFSLRDLQRIIKNINNYEDDEESIYIFDKCAVSDEASFNFITEKIFEIKKDFPGNKIYYLYRPGIASMKNKYIYKVQIALDGYNVDYNKFVVAPMNTNPANILAIASKSDDFPNIQISEAVFKTASEANLIDFNPSFATPENTKFITFEVDNLKIEQTFQMNDTIELSSHLIRFCSFIKPEPDEVPVQVSQVIIIINNFKNYVFRYMYEPFIINLKKTLTIREFKEKVLKCVKIKDKDDFLKTKLKVMTKGIREEMTKEKVEELQEQNDDDVLKNLRESSLIYVIYN